MADQQCPDCGARRQGKDPHCQGCGHTFVELPLPEPGVPSPPPSAGRGGRRSVMVIGGLVAVLAVGVGAALVLPDSESGTTVQDSPAEQGNTQQAAQGNTQQAVQPVTLESGTWSGEEDSSSVALSLEVAGGDATGVFRVRTQSGVVGSWNVTGQVDNGTLTLEPGSWISRPDGWSQESLQLQVGADGSLEGTTGDGDSANMRLVTKGVPDAQAVAADWRVALAMPEEQARGVLEQRRDEGSSSRDSLNGAWVTQVASGCEGLDQGSWDLTASSILASNARLDQELGAITVRWEDIATSSPENCPGTDMWVALVPQRFASSEAALRWCWKRADSCAARYIVPRGQKGTEIAY